MREGFGRSLKRALATRLILVMGLVWVLASGFAFWRTWEEVGEAYADQARHLAQVVVATLASDEEGLAEVGSFAQRGSARNYFVVVVEAGLTVYRSRHAPAEPGAAGPAWETATVSDPAAGLAVTVGLRSEEPLQLALSVASGVALPMLAGFLAMVLAVVTSVRREFAPLDRIRSELVRRSPRQLDPLRLDGLQDEVLPLAESLNALFARLSASMDHERRFIADASHELRTPLTAIKAHLQNIDGSGLDPETRDILGKIEHGVDRSGRLVQQLLTLARADAQTETRPTGEPVDLAVAVRQVLSDLFPEAVRAGVDLRLEGEPALVEADPLDLAILLRNLVENAIRYGGSSVAVFCGRAGPEAFVSVEDSGPGIPETERAEAFARFHRHARAAGPGSGLGLSIARSMAERWGGRVTLGASRELGGLSARLSLPGLRE